MVSRCGLNQQGPACLLLYQLSKACSLSSVKGHCLTHVGFSVNHFKCRAVGTCTSKGLLLLCVLVKPEWLVTFGYSTLYYPFQSLWDCRNFNLGIIPFLQQVTNP